MNIILNNNSESFEKSEMSIAEILKAKNFIFKMLVIKVNDNIIKKQAYETTIVKEGDNVVILHLVSGG
jgi:thiamine biosynthesis protein ThiS